MTTFVRRLSLAIFMVLLVVVSRPASAQDTIKLGYIEALSGPFASAGDEALKIFGYILEKVNAQGGALGKKFELVPFDDKLQPAEALDRTENDHRSEHTLRPAVHRIKCRRGAGRWRCQSTMPAIQTIVSCI